MRTVRKNVYTVDFIILVCSKSIGICRHHVRVCSDMLTDVIVRKQ